jgi:hypothetical protein
MGRLFMHDSQWPYGWLVFGGFLLLMGLGQACAGVAWGRGGPKVYRAEEPKKFWWAVALNMLVGVFFIVLYWMRYGTSD